MSERSVHRDQIQPTKPRRRWPGRLLTAVLGLILTGLAGWVVFGRSLAFDERASIALYVMIFLAIPLGIYYGTQKKEFWV